MLTKAKLDNLTKASLVAEVLKLQDIVIDSSADELTSAQIVKKQLTLAAKATDAEVKVEELRSNLELSIEKLRKQYELEATKTLEEVTGEYKKLKSEITNVDNALKSSVAQQEAEAKEAIAEIESKIAEAEARLVEAKETTAERISALKTESAEIQANVQKEHQRKMDDLKFEHERAVKQENTAYAERLAETLGLSLVPTAELERLKSIEPLSQKELDEKVKAEVGKVTGILTAKHERALSDKDHEAALAQVELKGRVQSLTEQVTSLQKREASLEAQVKEIPSVIEKALASAKAEVSVTNESAKK